ncbi:hypothetical protein FNV43_RR14232 [Rhamnella rubrinervis]|uniref:Cytochrome P450 724B1 n=1 Tax=Rhamnella rubrinervis TaxID=2594499 RepID=A0A8K0H2U8_9ROSA|nr:hypothetical protein FNV43_RR14232 [Rhamnella rubrinervis]
MGWPFFGETLEFLKPHSSNSIGCFLQQHCSRYGKVFKSHLFGSPTIVSCDLELNMFILQNEGKLFETSYPKPIHGILGKYSLLLVSGDLHKKLRNIVVSFTSSSKSTPEFLHCVENLSISMMESWKNHKQIAFFQEAKTFTLSVMVKHLLSIKPGEPLASEILQDFETYMKGFVSLPLYVPGTAYAKAVKARARLSSTVKEIIRKREKRNDDHEGLNTKGEDFLDVILSKQSLSDEEMVSIALDILLGGYETTSTLMALIVYFLGHAPNAFQKLKEEHQNVAENKKETEPLNWEDYKKMQFTYHIICEAMRCGNVVKFVHRKALRDVKFKGMVIPSGWKVLPIFTAAHFDPSLHDKPLEFNPWRWIHDKEISKKVTPFGGGPRLCPGAELAKVVTAVFLHHLVLNYRFIWYLKMSSTVVDVPPKGGFSFDLCRRNDMLSKNGVKPPSYRKTGTTIVGLIFQDGVILGADTRATEGPIVCDKNCEKIHYMAPNIYCCGAGTAADTEAVTDMVSSQLQLHRYHTGRESRVVTALTLLKKHLFNYQGYVQAALVLGGVDVTGPHLHTIYPHGSTDTLPFATMGSGSLAAMSVFESKYKEGLTREEGIQLVSEAICSGIFNDLGSGSNVDVCVITKGHKEYLRNHLLPNPRTYVSSKGYTFSKKTEVLLTKITPLKEKVEVIGGDAMEE